MFVFQKFLFLSTKISTILSELALAGIVGAFCWEVTARYFFSAPTEWASDVVVYLLSCVIFLGIPELTRTKGHVAITFLIDYLPAEKRAIADRLSALVGMIVCAAAAWMSLEQTLKQAERGISTLGTISIPKYWISGVIAFGLTWAALHFLQHLIKAKKEV